MSVKVYSLKKDGEKQLSENFFVKEFRCHDGSDAILISDELVELLQTIRNKFGAVAINSAYRTEAYNKSINGASRSQHVQGTAADIITGGHDPKEVVQWIEACGHIGGLGYYPISGFTHVDTRGYRSYFQEYEKSRTRTVLTFGRDALTTTAETEETELRYERLADIPNEFGFQDIIGLLMIAGVIQGDGSDTSGNTDKIDLSHDQVRTLVFIYRGGAFDKALVKAGLAPAVV